MPLKESSVHTKSKQEQNPTAYLLSAHEISFKYYNNAQYKILYTMSILTVRVAYLMILCMCPAGELSHCMLYTNNIHGLSAIILYGLDC